METWERGHAARIRGLCAPCRAWFPCDDWFDASVPTPCCPACDLPPVKIECVSPGGVLVIGMDHGHRTRVGEAQSGSIA